MLLTLRETPRNSKLISYFWRIERLLISRRAALAGSLASTAMSSAQRGVLFGGGAPYVDLDFLSGILDPRMTFTRASAGWYFDSSGVLTQASTNVARFDYNPTTLTLNGLLVEAANTNSLRNNSMTGAVVGTPGTLPTNWTQSNNSGLAANVVATGTDHGIPYIDLRINGTTAVFTDTNIVFEAVGTIAALQNQVWTSSAYLSLSAGSLTNVASIKNFIQPLTNAGGTLTISSATATVTGAALASQRNAFVYTLPDATTAFVRNFIKVVFAAAPVAVDLTLRIGAPQLELSAYASSPILTTSAAVTRAVDNPSILLPSTPKSGVSVVTENMPRAAVVSVFSAVDDGTNSNRIQLFTADGSTYGYFAGVSGSSIINRSVSGSVVVGTPMKFGAAVSSSNRTALCVNGGAVTVDTTAGAFPPGMTTARPGRPASAASINVWCRRLRVWPSAISDSTLQTATT
jgi:hypothetical protein